MLFGSSSFLSLFFDQFSVVVMISFLKQVLLNKYYTFQRWQILHECAHLCARIGAVKIYWQNSVLLFHGFGLKEAVSKKHMVSYLSGLRMKP